jgi:hypothetical protein
MDLAIGADGGLWPYHELRELPDCIYYWVIIDDHRQREFAIDRHGKGFKLLLFN